MPFRASALLFRIALALEIFEQVRPGGILLADFAFGASLLLLLLTDERRLLKSKGSGIMAAVAVILCGALLSGITVPGVKIFVLFGLFAPLAIAHARNIRANLLFLIAGVSANCVIAILAASVWPKLEDTLAVTADVVDPGQDIGSFPDWPDIPPSLDSRLLWWCSSPWDYSSSRRSLLFAGR